MSIHRVEWPAGGGRSVPWTKLPPGGQDAGRESGTTVKTASPEPYGLLARFYDTLADYAPAMNRHARERILGRILDQARSACDLACGSGETALALARRGLRVYAADFSPTFCRPPMAATPGTA